ncbi:hypothetical protein S40285_09269 [Stachybotrys chlorohalonatus IBT 40285]|uniref:Heterokaryon incompatibility domain-containing protein n=1 Tax=Stachybotrys chlorohalonatus (strain IBT 40285) TaxID=1283841 RepID=A0A084R233_STAC4|nr:hypothetical protein S40285_09269 [Stachybotrys chlorohalonata IBT 40285]
MASDSIAQDTDCDSLRCWYEGYVAAHDVARFCEPLAHVDLDLESIEQQIKASIHHIEVLDGFCSVCQAVFDDWPRSLRSPSKDDYDEKEERASEAESIDDTPGGTSDTAIKPLPDIGTYPAWEWNQGGSGTATLSMQPDTITLEAAVRAGCRCLIENRLEVLHQSFEVSLLVQTWTDRDAAYLVEYTFPGRRFTREYPSYPSLPSCAFDFAVYRDVASVKSKSHPDVNSVTPKPSNVDFPMSLDRVLLQVKEWTSTCLSSHSACNATNVTELPTRLLSLSAKPVRLVKTIDLTSKPRYAALSYCWGRADERLCLTDDNFDALSLAMPNEILPRTFQDAIVIAQSAGLDYLWIDSLCIIQDNTHDWEVEAGRMASVYGGSSLTIAASSAKDANGGCFLRAPNGCSGFNARLSVGGRLESVQIIDLAAYTKYVTQPHLASRAWAVQEKILSPRTLHCGVRGFFWECRTCVGSEFFPNGFNADEFDEALVWQFSDLDPEEHVLNNLRRWKSIKEWYSGCDLTYPSDKLIAISGIARDMQQHSGDQYFAGLWRKNMIAELCWHVLKPCPRPPYRAPSWSWASVDGSVFTERISPYEDVFAHIQSVDILNRTDSFGAVTGGSLSLECRCLVSGQVISRAAARNEYMLGSKEDGENYEIYVNVGHEKYDFAFAPDCWGADEEKGHIGEVVYFLPLHGGEDGGAQDLEDGTQIFSKDITGIVLQSSDLQMGIFFRIGFFEFSYRFGGWGRLAMMDEYHPFLQAMEKSRPGMTRDTPFVASNTANDNGKHFLVHIT